MNLNKGKTDDEIPSCNINLELGHEGLLKLKVVPDVQPED